VTPAGDAPAALFSIHDVMPETLADVRDLLELFAERELPAPALLVVPGRAWSADDLAQLRQWADSGCELIAHGWVHHTRPRRFYHRLHALLLSRNVAEHLALDEGEILQLMRRSRDWFAGRDLPMPDTYIPPAWALGLRERALAHQPFARIETLTGLALCGAEQVRRLSLPLLGFEADTRFRAAVLRFWNRRQQRRAVSREQPLRIALHPPDAGLLLRDQLLQVLDSPWRCLRYADIQP
jgi:predicted deacetylase